MFQVLDLCLQVGEVLLSSGEAAADTSATMTRLAGACGLDTVDVDITFTSITMCCRRGKAAAPVTSMRLVRYRTTDLTRLTLVTRIVDQVVRGEMGLAGCRRRAGRRRRAPHPYPRWVATAGWAGLAAAVALLLGGGPVIWMTAFVTTAIIDRLGRFLGRLGAAPFFLQMIGGFVATACTVGLLAVGALPSETGPSLVIAASITVLLSGLSVMGAVQDAIAGHVVTAAGRAAEIALLSAGLLTGVILGLKTGIWFGLFLDPAEPVAADVTRFGISTFAAAAAAAMFALACYAPLRSLAAAALAGATGWVAYGALTQYADLGPVVATGLAAVLVGLGSELIRRRTAVHRQVIILSGIIPLLPGLTAYRGFYQLAASRPQYIVRRSGHHHPRAGHRPRPRRRCDVRPVHRPAPPRAGDLGAEAPRLAVPSARTVNRSGGAAFAGGHVGGDVADQRGELGAVPGAGGDQRDAVDPVDEEVLARRAGEQAGRLGVGLGNQAGKVLPDVVDDAGAVRRVDDPVLVGRRRDPAPAEELGDLLPPEPGVAAARQTVDPDGGSPVDERRPPVRCLLPVGEVEGVLLGDLQGRDERAEPAGSGSRSSSAGSHPPAVDDDAFGVERPAVAGLEPVPGGRRRHPGDRPTAEDPGAVALRLLEQCAHRALGVDHPGAGVPEGLAVDGDLRPARPGVGRAQQLVLDTDRVEDAGEGVDVADRPEVQRAGRGDQPTSAQPFQLVEAGPGCHDEADVEGVVVGVAEDAGRAVRAAVAGGGLRPLHHRHLVPAAGEAPRGGGAGQAGPDDDVPRRAHRVG